MPIIELILLYFSDCGTYQNLGTTYCSLKFSPISLSLLIMSPSRNWKFSHNQCRPLVCLVCYKVSKTTVRPATLQVYENIKGFRSDIKIDQDDSRAPSGICSTHRTILAAKSPSNEKILALEFKYSNYDNVSLSNPESRDCVCEVCVTIKGRGTHLKKSEDPLSNDGSVNLPSPSSSPLKKGQKRRKCYECDTEIFVGITEHYCTPGTKTKNMIQDALENPKRGQAIAAAVIKATPQEPDGTIYLQGQAGRPLPITIGVSKEPESLVYSVEDLVQLRQIVPGMSNAACKRVCTWLNTKHGRGTVETGFQGKLRNLDKIFEDHFEVREFPFKNKKGQLVNLPVAICKNMHNFIERVIELRGIDPTRSLLKLMVDKGQGFLKVSCSLVDLDEVEDEVRFKSNGVNKLFHLAILHSALEECHHNLQLVLDHMNVYECSQKFLGTFLRGGDFKIINIWVGKQTQASTYPDFACKLKQDQHKSMKGSADLLTLGQCFCNP